MVNPGSKKLVIPKGTLDPNANNIIEIPPECQHSKILVAKSQSKSGCGPQASSGYSLDRRAENVSMGLSSIRDGKSGCQKSSNKSSAPKSPMQSSCGPKDCPSRTANKKSTKLPASLTNSLEAPKRVYLLDALAELNKLEFVEMENIQQDIRQFQKARRKILFDVLTMENTTGPS